MSFVNALVKAAKKEGISPAELYAQNNAGVKKSFSPKKRKTVTNPKGKAHLTACQRENCISSGQWNKAGFYKTWESHHWHAGLLNQPNWYNGS